MNRNHILTYAVITTGVLIYQGWKIQKVVNLLDRVVDVVDKHLDADIQQDVDELFQGIIENLD